MRSIGKRVGFGIAVLISGALSAGTPDMANAWWRGADGCWDDPSGWSGDLVPTSADVVAASNNYGTATSPYVIRVTNGVAAACKQLYLDSTDDRLYCGAPDLEIEPGGSLTVDVESYLNFRSKLHVQSGAQFKATKLFVGLADSASLLGARASGVFVNDGVASMTDATLRRNGVITNNGEMAIAYLKVGGDSGGGRVVVAGGTLDITKECSIAKDGSDVYSSELLVTGGEVRNSGYMRAGYAERDRSGTRVTITGEGTKWINSGTGTANDNGVIIGKYNDKASYMTNCWFVVSNGARFENACAMYFGRMAGAASGQRVEGHVVVTNGATFVCRNNVTLAELYKESSDSTSTIDVTVDQADFHVTNRTGTAELSLGTPMKGTGTSTATGTLNVLNGGLVCCDTLNATNGAQSVANIVSGVLWAKSAQVDGAAAQSVGQLGATGGEWRLGAGGINVFKKGLDILPGAALGVELDAAGNAGYADLTDQVLTFEKGSRLAVTLNGLTPKLHQTWKIAFAAEIVGLPKAPKGWQVSTVPAEDGVCLQIEHVPSSGLIIAVH